MGVVVLLSGGLDSSLIGILTQEKKQKVFPLFVNYGQRALEKEWNACKAICKEHNLPQPVKADLSGFGQLIETGLTSEELDVVKDAFTPNRNLLFLLIASSYAFQVGAGSVAIGLLNEETSLFPDQTSEFLINAERAIQTSLGKIIKVLAPLSSFSKADVLELANAKGLHNTYSCHIGGTKPCGTCISCKEIKRSS